MLNSNPQVQQAINAGRSGQGQNLFNHMMNTNPQFQQFMQSVQGMTPQQFLQQQGINPAQFFNML